MFGLRRIESIAPRHASDRFFTGEIVIVDVRTTSEYAQVRVPGAIHIPLLERARARRRAPRGPAGGVPLRLEPPQRRSPPDAPPSSAPTSSTWRAA